MSKSTETTPKDKKLRHAEYYGMTDMFDGLYEKAKRKDNFNKLMPIITSDNNILLAYRNIKRNKGSKTSACDNVNIKDIEKLSQQDFLNEVKTRFKDYHPKMVRRKEIPKPNGKMRPLGIPSMWDRIIQQCILQVMEPICEAHFCARSYGFRPNRSAEHAMADVVKKVNRQKLTFVVDVDIQGFFDEVNHVKLRRQLWTMGFHDKQLLAIIQKMLKAPIKMPNGKVVYPTKGTPQGGILSPLLANVNLNEFDWWVSDQWETFKARNVKTYIRKDGLRDNGHVYKALRRSNLKPMFIVRYADDFKIFTDTLSNARKIFEASKMWLEGRLKLPISTEKSKVTNLKKQESEFLGFTIKAVKKGKDDKGQKCVAMTHIAPKALEKIKLDLTEQVKKIQKVPNSIDAIKEIYRYNSIVIGKHNYYQIATHVSQDVQKIQHDIDKVMYNRLPKASKRGKMNTNGYTKNGNYEGRDKGIIPYLKSENMRFLMKRPIVPISYVRCKNPMMKKQAINKYTEDGRIEIHKKLDDAIEWELKWIREHPVINERATVEFNDNRIALYIAQKGRCSVTGDRLLPWSMHCHHKQLWELTHDDSYKNLTLVKPSIHRLIHASIPETILKLFEELALNEEQMKKLNKLRKQANQRELTVSELTCEVEM